MIPSKPESSNPPDTPNSGGDQFPSMSIIDLDCDILILKGSAGTGKTTLVARWVNELLSRDISFTLLAPTGRAAKILKDKTRRDTNTIHGEIYSFEDVKGTPTDDEKEISMENAGQLYLQFFLRPTAIDAVKASIFIIDESSMISRERMETMHTARFGNNSLLDDILTFAAGNKIVFVGDHCQLPPIGPSSFSPALSAQFLQDTYHKKVREIILTQNWRHGDGNEILEMATFFRNHILNNTCHRQLKIPYPGSRNVFLMESWPEMIKDYLSVIGPKRDYGRATFIAATNKLVGEINAQVRLHLGINGLPSPGELLLIVQNNQVTPLVNGDLVILKAIKPDITVNGISFSKVIVQSLHNNEHYECLMINNLLYNAEPTLNVIDAGKLIIHYDQRARLRGIKRGSNSYKNGLQKDPYLNALRVKFGYTLTCHKAQGGEWDHVFLALNGAQYYYPPETSARWYYTALTRARQKLFINKGAWIQNKMT